MLPKNIFESPGYRELASLHHSAVLAIAPGGLIEFANPQAASMFGLQSDELIGLPAVELAPLADRAAYLPWSSERASDTLAHTLRVREEVCARHRDGHEFPIQISHALVASPDGPYIVIVVSDLGPVRRLEQSLKTLERASALGTLAAGIAHDFNNVLHAVREHTERARRFVGDTPQGDLRHAVNASHRGSQLVERLLGSLRGQEVPRRSQNVAAIVSHVAQSLRPTLPRDVTLQLALDAAAPDVEADALAIVRIVTNLVSNAAHAMPAGGPVHVNVRSFVPSSEWVSRHPKMGQGPHVRLEVLDSGVGMSPEVLREAFEMGFTTRQGGSGIGLHVVRQVVSDLRGVIEVETAPGYGTFFQVTLPAGARR